MNTFTPTNTDDTLYILSSMGYTLHELYDQAQKHFGRFTLEDFKVGSEYVQTRSIGHDQYDSADYDLYLVITRN